MDPSDILRRKQAAAVYGGFKTYIQTKPGCTMPSCTPGSGCTVRYTDYATRNQVMIGKQVCDCSGACFIGAPKPSGS